MPNSPRDVLLLVDFQKGFDAGGWPARWNQNLDANATAVLSAWRKSGRPIIHVRHDSIEPNSSLRPDQAGNDFRSGLEPLASEPVVSKSVNSAFIGTDLDLRLRRLGANRVFVMGISTDMCVSTTIRTGANMGWPMVLIADACDCFDLPDGKGGIIPAEQIQAAHVATLGFEFCTVNSTVDILETLQES